MTIRVTIEDQTPRAVCAGPARRFDTEVGIRDHDTPWEGRKTARQQPATRHPYWEPTNLVCTPGDSGDNTVAAAAVNAAGYHIPAGTPAPIVAVITFALAQLGKPYVYGGNGPNGWDCSGLIQGAYLHIGVQLPRTTFDQVNGGSPVYITSELQPGDLLFIPGSDGTPEAPGHVGMYLGNNLLIQAPQTGEVVKISPLSQWTGSIVAMRRVVKQN